MVFSSMLPVMPHLKSGRLAAIATAAAKRTAALPELPTFRESGIDYETGTWFGVLVPTGTPREIVATLRAGDRPHREIARRPGAGVRGRGRRSDREHPRRIPGVQSRAKPRNWARSSRLRRSPSNSLQARSTTKLAGIRFTDARQEGYGNKKELHQEKRDSLHRCRSAAAVSPEPDGRPTGSLKTATRNARWFCLTARQG